MYFFTNFINSIISNKNRNETDRRDKIVEGIRRQEGSREGKSGGGAGTASPVDLNPNICVLTPDFRCQGLLRHWKGLMQIFLLYLKYNTSDMLLSNFYISVGHYNSQVP